MKDLVKSEGIVCRILPFQEHDLILTAFTEGEGFVKFFIKKALLRKELRSAGLSPLARAEFVYSKGKSELFPCREVSVIDFHIRFRENLNWMQAALDLLSAAQSIFCAMHPVPLAYQLCVRFLEAIPKSKDPLTLVSSFRLKILFNEGTLSFERHPVFSTDEWTVIEQLISNRSLAAFQDLVLPDYLHKKIALFFQHQAADPSDSAALLAIATRPRCNHGYTFQKKV